MPTMKASLFKQIFLSVFAQGISLLAGFVLHLVVPVFLDAYTYASFQSYLLYAQYMTLLHFGLLDGLLLRYANHTYDTLDHRAVRSQYLAILAVDLTLSILMTAGAFLLTKGELRERLILLAWTAIAEIAFHYVSFTFQMTGRISLYAVYTVVYRVLYCISVLISACLTENALLLCLLHILCTAASAVCFGFLYSKKLFFGPCLPPRCLMAELRETLSGGSKLMLASYASLFLLGSGKMVIEQCYDSITFAKTALSFSLSGLALQFLTAASIVLFPTMKKTSPEKLTALYPKLRTTLPVFVLSAWMLYFPTCLILRIWLPKYAESLHFWAILLPMLLYSAKVNLIFNNYLKAFRKEKLLFAINLLSILIAFPIFLWIGKTNRDISLLLLCIVIAVAGRSLVEEIAVLRLLHHRISADLFLELLMSAIFMASTHVLSLGYACAVYGTALFLYLLYKCISASMKKRSLFLGNF